MAWRRGIAVTIAGRVVTIAVLSGIGAWVGARWLAPGLPHGWMSSRSGERGEREFIDACAPCHDRSGQGVVGKGRPLVDSPWITGPPSRLIRIMLDGVAHTDGLGSPPTVPMPSWRIVDDEYIASAATYVRQHFGRGATPVDRAEVREIRRATAGRTRAWTRDELNGIP